MKEPGDQDSYGERLDRSKSPGKRSLSSLKSASRSAVREGNKALEDATDETLTEGGGESYLEDDDYSMEHLEGSSSSFQDDYVETIRESQYLEAPASASEGAEEEVKKKISENFFYDYMELVLMPFVTPDSNIPLDLLTLVHSFGYDCKKRANLQLLDSNTVMYIAGNQLILLNLKTKEQIYLRSSSGRGIGVIGVHPDKTYFTVAEKGVFPKIIIYEYPSLRPYRILQDGTELAYAYVDFNYDGTLLASVGSNPDHTLIIWNWKEEQPILKTKAFSQEVFKVTFNPEDDEQLTTAGSGHIKFWEIALTFTGLKLQGSLGRFGKTATTDIEGYMELPDGKVLSGSEWGNMLLWEGGLIKVELCRAARKSCHQGPINQIVLDEGEVITIGADGCIRIWDFETVDTADSIDETGLLEIEPINELQVGKNVKLFSMIKMNEIGSNFWLAQDASGAIWKLDLSFSNITQDPDCLFSFHSGAIEALAVSPLTYLMATTALDCSVRIYDFASKTPLAQMKFKQGGTALAWVPRLVSYNGAQIIVGFEDGVVRVLELYDPKRLTVFAGRKKVSDADISLKQVFKPHTARVTALAYERDGEILATGSEDQTVFFFEVEKDYKPIGYITTPGPVCQLIWSPNSHPDSTLLIICENGYVLETPYPTIKEEEENRDVVSYEIKDMYIKCFHFSSVKSKTLRFIEIEKRKRLKELKEKQKEERRKQLAAEMGGNGEKEFHAEEEEVEAEEPLPEIFIPSTPCHILCGFYSEPGKFWVSLGGYDAGFLYHCEFPPYDKNSAITEMKNEPFDFRRLEDTEDNPIQAITFSIHQDLMFCGMQDGAIRVYILSQNNPSLMNMVDYWHFNIHDNNYGCVKGISTSFDDRFLVTTGADSNIFVFTIFSEFELKKSIKAKVPSPRFGIEAEPIPEDIEDPKSYSIENARRKREHDKLMKEVEEIKAGKREKLKALRNEFWKLLEMNQELPKHMQFKRTDFDVDSKIRAEIARKTAFKIHQVEKELAWEKEKHELGLMKLQNRFRESLENDIIVVRAIQSDHKISSYRLVKPSKYSKFKRISLTERRTSKLERSEKEGAGRKDSQKDTGGSISVPEESIIEEGKKFRPKTLSEIMVENQIEKTRKLILKAERAQLKIQQRKKEWEELYKSKPQDDFEDPRDVQAIKEAQLYMGDFNLKTAPDYKIPEHMRVNAAKKEEELGHLDSMAHSKKKNMNKCIISLRDLKVAVIEEIQCLVQELKTIQATLHISKHIPIPEVPQIYPEEVPEKRFQYDEEILLNFKQQQIQDEKSHQLEQGESAGSAGGFFKLSSRKDGDLTTDSLSKSSKASASSADTAKLSEFEKVDPIDVELEIMKRDEIKHLYMQQYLTNRIKELIVTFDAELRLLRHQKLKLDTQMKLSDLHHVTLFQEMLLLKNFEKQENILQERVNSLDKEEQDMQWKISETLKEMEEKKNEIAKFQDQEKALYAGFQAAIGENNKFANFLMKVLKKRIKRVKKKEVEGDADEDEDSDESSEEESSLESGEDESGSDDEVFDDSICPTNCDVGLFEMALQLREKRLDIEEALVEEKKSIDNLRKEHDALSKKVKIVATNLNAAEEALEAYQREKQQRLNELMIVIPLKLHQIEHVVFGEIPSDLSGTLVFSNQSLSRLQERITQLHEENAKQQKLNKECRERRKQLIREKREMAKTISKMEETVRQLMISKFGRVIDLEALQTLSVNTTLEELKIRKIRKELLNAKEMKMWEEKIAQVRWELMMKTKEHTKKLHQMNDLCIEKKKLDSRLNTLQNQQGNAFQGPRKADIVAKEKVAELIQLQAERILALKEEIALLRKKGGLILPPIQPPQEKEMNPMGL
ncbi:cilia- and flagella-associated protein 44 isoform X1 [Canis lupus familiaris]|uniref:Cilia- and flagella-associated protein 44 n=2 Tax=Canis lupus familiaris TaxID=9615 RepID=A0A8P0NCM3_CANLF|nr:cilia- and flagella-associated protein 44 isoform X1 [Canis lupus familiaris]XP_038318347.1 cilia- and flagella-associated protein 44 isoform X1 [Canis lupus familiaris]XP_038318348.1 cilia- and flagella-associated protein 44 isoform X1 [Canis lupus familiaris]XP_038318349.1 cilia- and flagella-associated protein 44 isoform X1 [Canis lupus familiaris]XP_038318350.1 cilia- and flagella-associated protein 44 isoform X1 [Canis lupus familiaris]XP_038318351.1 cilia- and flagella-associated prot